ncbi:hypothetical protein K1719_016850 [Acacia pycnantha]|nr:hypothetical protein K1719_016850 [Acacia pycnantha]
MSMKPSDSTENMALPVTDPPRDQDGGKLFNGSAMTKRGGYAAISYMSCAAGMLLLLALCIEALEDNFFQSSYFDISILVCYYTFSLEKPVVLIALALCGAMV